MSELGVQQQCQYPGFPESPMDSFKHLAHDLEFTTDFLSGPGLQLISASQKEAAETAERASALAAGYVGDTRKLEQLKVSFNQRHYYEVIKLADGLRFPERMKDSERKMVEIARRKMSGKDIWRRLLTSRLIWRSLK